MNSDERLVTHPLLALRLRHLLDGIAEHGTGHLVGMLAKELTEEVHGNALTHLSQHPTHGLVHEVVGVVQVDLCIAEAPRRVALLGGFP